MCFNQMFNKATKFRDMFGDNATTPSTIRTMYGAGLRAAARHSRSPYPMFTNVRGLKNAIPRSPDEAKGLPIEAIRDNDPATFFERKAMHHGAGREVALL